MGRVARYLGLFVGVGFVVHLALELATFELPPPPVPLSGTRAEQALMYAAIYAGIGASSSIFIIRNLIAGVVGAGLALLFLPRGQPLSTGVALACGGIFAVTTFLLGDPAVRSIGEAHWFVCAVVIGTLVTYLGGRVSSRHAG